jgi:hypothetical protein
VFDNSTKSCSRFFVIIASLQNLDFRDIKGVLRIVAISATIRNTPIKFEALPRDPTTLQVYNTGLHKVLPSHLSCKFGISCCFLTLPLVLVRFVDPGLQRRIVSILHSLGRRRISRVGFCPFCIGGGKSEECYL